MATVDAVDSDADRSQFNILARVRTPAVPTATAMCGVVARGSDTGGVSNDTTVAAFIYGTELRIGRFNGGVPTPLLTTSGRGLAADTFYFIRFDGSNAGTPGELKARIWTGAEEDEPGTWDLEVTDGTPVTADGYCGFWCFSTGHNYLCSDIAIATGGAVATFSASSAATAVALSGPSGGTNGVASTDFTAGADGTITGDLVVTPSDGGDGGTFTPTSVTLNTGNPTDTFTYTPASTGVKTISVTNDGGLTNPSSISYTSTDANAAPVWDTAPSDMTTKRGQALTPQDLSALVSDADMDTLDFSCTGLPTGVTCNSGTGIVSGTPTAAPGVYTVTPSIDDGVNSPVDGTTFDITVQQCVLAVNALGYEFGNGNSPATMAVDDTVAWEVEVIDDALPPSSVYHSDSLTTSSLGRLADIGDDDFLYGTTYTVLARRVSDGEWGVFTIAAT